MLSTYGSDCLKYGYDKEGRINRCHDQQFTVWSTVRSFQYHSGKRYNYLKQLHPL